jgi:hypothetical protein
MRQRRAAVAAIATIAAAAALMPLLLMSACGDDGGSASSDVRVDTVGGIIRLTNTGPGAWGPDEAWRLGDEVRIGADPAAEEAFAFGDITGLTVAADGRIYVADGQAKEICAFSPTGEFLFRFGRSGEGPGEFGAIDALARTPQGDILARDPRLFRITRFAVDGGYIALFRIQRPFQQYASGLGFAIDRDGVVHDRLSVMQGIESDDSLAIIRYSPDGALHDTLIVAQTPRRSVQVVRDGLLVMGLTVPFTPFGSAVVGPDGTIARTEGSAYSFDLIGRGGEVLRTVVRDVAPARITATERDSALTAMREIVREYSPGGQLQDFEFPATKASITHLLADAAGNWWVGANNSANRLTVPAQFDVFDSDGRYLGSMAVPFRSLEIGADYIAGVSVDELGVQSVVVVPLIKPTG